MGAPTPLRCAELGKRALGCGLVAAPKACAAFHSSHKNPGKSGECASVLPLTERTSSELSLAAAKTAWAAVLCGDRRYPPRPRDLFPGQGRGGGRGAGADQGEGLRRADPLLQGARALRRSRQEGAVIREESDGFKLLLDLQKHDRAAAVAALEAIVARLKGVSPAHRNQMR